MPLTPLHILHLEDDALDADLVRRELARLDTEPTWVSATSAEEFYDALERQHFDAVLSDNRLPGIEGLHALQVVRERRPQVPFVFVSGNPDPRWAERCIEAGATDYVPKHQLWRLPSALRRLNEARENERLRALTRGHAVLIDVVKQLSHARSTEAIVDIVRHGARALNQADGATVVLRDDGFCHYVNEDAIGPLWKGKRFPLPTCISGWTMLNGCAAVIPDIYRDPRIPHEAYRPTFVKSLVMVPIRAHSPIGAIGNYWATPHSATPDEVSLIQALADSTSLAFENVALLEGLEQRVQQRTAELEEANRELEAFSYSVSHDLRAPLRAVLGYSELLLDTVQPPLQGEPLKFLQTVRSSAQRMNTLIEDMLALSRVTRTELHRHRVPLGLLAREILDGLQAAAPERQVAVVVDEDAIIFGDMGLLRLALENLLSNAWKFTSRREHGARIVFSTEPAPHGLLRCCISDNGAGFDMAYGHQLFEPFRRLHRDSEFPGTGVGLAIVRRVIHRHGGEIHADAVKGEGARFIFTLPAEATGDALG